MFYTFRTTHWHGTGVHWQRKRILSRTRAVGTPSSSHPSFVVCFSFFLLHCSLGARDWRALPLALTKNFTMQLPLTTGKKFLPSSLAVFFLSFMRGYMSTGKWPEPILTAVRYDKAALRAGRDIRSAKETPSLNDTSPSSSSSSTSSLSLLLVAAAASSLPAPYSASHVGSRHGSSGSSPAGRVAGHLSGRETGLREGSRGSSRSPCTASTMRLTYSKCFSRRQ